MDDAILAEIEHAQGIKKWAREGRREAYMALSSCDATWNTKRSSTTWPERLNCWMTSAREPYAGEMKNKKEVK